MQSRPEDIHSATQAPGGLPATSGPQSRRAAWLASASRDADRLDAMAASKLEGEPLRTPRVLVIGFEKGHLSNIRQGLGAIGVLATATASNVHRLREFATAGLGFSHVIISFDAFGDVAEGVDALMAFRRIAPDVSVVMCSEHVGGDDFGSERARICDATLKLPTSAARMADVLSRRSHATA